MLSVDEAATERAAVRAHLRAAEADCLLLYRLLPAVPGWSGAASWAFGLRLAELRARVAAAHAALAAAEAAL
ncbi:hypothetical protein GCM10022287_05330 [Gryllotalpicola koreensis]|uniref:HNH endonuclease n=1 Tax=Gryllotalpicola koreensis TaxID=993086 RepID=A0ABP7ZSF4_9MICO